MFTKTMTALFAALVLTVSFAANANAQRGCVSGEESTLSAYPSYSHCR